MQSYAIKKIGENKGAPRIWIEGKNPEVSGFAPGATYSVTIDATKLMMKIVLDDDGARKVSSKRVGENMRPIIDLNSIELLSLFDGIDLVRVIFDAGIIFILPVASEVRRRQRLQRISIKLEQSLPITMGSVSHGGGILSHALHAGLENSGFTVELDFANDIREDLLTHAQAVNSAWDSSTKYLAAPLQEIAFDEYAITKLKTVDILEGGLPCSGASVAGRAKRKTHCAEAHPDVGHLAVGFLVLIARLNPVVVVLENVPAYADSASMCILRSQLRDLGYQVHEQILHGGDWNALEHRQRMAMVAVTNGINFDFDKIERPRKISRVLAEILDPVSDDDPRWSDMEGLKRKQERDIAAGKSFLMQIFDEGSPKIGTLTKGLGKNRSTDPKIRNKSNRDLLRIPTPAEHARCKGIPLELVEGLCATTAHEMLGQSVVWDPFAAVGAVIGDALHTWYSDQGRAVASHSAVTNQLVACG